MSVRKAMTVGALMESLSVAISNKSVTLDTPVAVSADPEGNAVSPLTAIGPDLLDVNPTWLDWASVGSSRGKTYLVLWP